MSEGNADTINTGVGAFIRGNVMASGDFIGRDKHEHHHYAPKQPDWPLFFNVPSTPNHFVGREALLDALVAQLLEGKALALSAEGQGGIGKTTLAVAVAHDSRVRAHFSDGVLWVGLGQQGEAMSALGRWGEALGVDVSLLPDAPARAQAVKNAIGQRKLLLVIDDAWSLDAALALRCGGPGCCHLLTTRDAAIAREFAGAAHASKVPDLSDEKAFELLSALAPEACADDPATARVLAAQVGGLPLALELLGGFLTAPEHSLFPELSAAAFAELADPQRRLQLARVRLGAEAAGPQTLQAVIELSLSSLSDEARRAFYALGAFAVKPDRFDLDAAKIVAECDAATLALLVGCNLLEKEGERLALHPTVADVARQQMPDEVKVLHRRFYLDIVTNDHNDWRTIENIYPQIQHAWRQLDKADDPLEMIWALNTYHELRGIYQDGLDWVLQGLSWAENLSWLEGINTGDDTSALLNTIGARSSKLGNPKRALEYYQRALLILEEVGDRVHQAMVLSNMSVVFGGLGKWKRALEYSKRALLIYQEVDDVVEQRTTLSNMGMAYNNIGDPTRALEYYGRALQICQAVGDRAGQGTTLSNMGVVYKELGDTTQALEYCKRALPINEEAGDRVGEGETLNNMSVIYFELGDRIRALEYCERALRIYAEVGARAHEAIARYNIANIDRAEGRLAEAVAQLEHVVKLNEQVHSPNLEEDRAHLAEVRAELDAARAAGSAPAG